MWRASADGLTDLAGNSCTAKEAAILATVFDSDEGTQQINGCPSPCPKTSLNFPYETQRTGVDQIGALAVNGWAYMNFLGAESNVTSAKDLDQAWVDYEMSSGVAFVNASVPGTQLDPSTCHPEGLTDLVLRVREGFRGLLSLAGGTRPQLGLSYLSGTVGGGQPRPLFLSSRPPWRVQTLKEVVERSLGTKCGR